MDVAWAQNITYWSLITTAMLFYCFDYLIVRPDVPLYRKKIILEPFLQEIQNL